MRGRKGRERETGKKEEEIMERKSIATDFKKCHTLIMS